MKIDYAYLAADKRQPKRWQTQLAYAGLTVVSAITFALALFGRA